MRNLWDTFEEIKIKQKTYLSSYKECLKMEKEKCESIILDFFTNASNDLFEVY